jgi:hypothetical protein
MSDSNSSAIIGNLALMILVMIVFLALIITGIIWFLTRNKGRNE